VWEVVKVRAIAGLMRLGRVFVVIDGRSTGVVITSRLMDEEERRT